MQQRGTQLLAVGHPLVEDTGTEHGDCTEGQKLKWRVIYLATAREIERLCNLRALAMLFQVVQLYNIDISCMLLCI